MPRMLEKVLNERVECHVQQFFRPLEAASAVCGERGQTA